MFQSKTKPAQQSLWIPTEEIVSTPANSFYTRFDKALVAMGFPEQVRALCLPFYDQRGRGRPGIDPLVYFKMLMIGFFENLSSEPRPALLRDVSQYCGVARTRSRSGAFCDMS